MYQLKGQIESFNADFQGKDYEFYWDNSLFRRSIEVQKHSVASRPCDSSAHHLDPEQCFVETCS